MWKTEYKSSNWKYNEFKASWVNFDHFTHIRIDLDEEKGLTSTVQAYLPDGSIINLLIGTTQECVEYMTNIMK